jgi:hypothetical protein
LLKQLKSPYFDGYEPDNASDNSPLDLSQCSVEPAAQYSVIDPPQVKMPSNKQRKRKRQKGGKQRAKRDEGASEIPVQPDNPSSDEDSTGEVPGSFSSMSLETSNRTQEKVKRDKVALDNEHEELIREKQIPKQEYDTAVSEKASLQKAKSQLAGEVQALTQELETPDEKAVDMTHDDQTELQPAISHSLQTCPTSAHPAPLSPVVEKGESEITPTKYSIIDEHPLAITDDDLAPVGNQSPVPSTTSSGPSEATAVPSASELSLATAVPSSDSPRFSFDNYQPETRCRNPDYRKSTHPLDGNTKICPTCGPRSMVRYCSKTCVYKDVRRHFLVSLVSSIFRVD